MGIPTLNIRKIVHRIPTIVLSGPRTPDGPDRVILEQHLRLRKPKLFFIPVGRPTPLNRTFLPAKRNEIGAEVSCCPEQSLYLWSRFGHIEDARELTR